MAGLRTCLVLATGMAIGGALVIAHRVSEETGKGLAEAFADVPGEAQRILEDVKVRAEEAVDRARQAYEQKQADGHSWARRCGRIGVLTLAARTICPTPSCGHRGSRFASVMRVVIGGASRQASRWAARRSELAVELARQRASEGPIWC
jgi:hypothetical protein